MTSFEAGFLAYTEECGLSEKQASHMLQRALDHEAVSTLFSHSKVAAISLDYADMNVLHNLAHQDLIDQEMTQLSQRINS